MSMRPTASQPSIWSRRDKRLKSGAFGPQRPAASPSASGKQPAPDHGETNLAPVPPPPEMMRTPGA